MSNSHYSLHQYSVDTLLNWIDVTYALTAEALEESDKVKLFEHFIDDLKQVIEDNQ